jgi:hypothetical protein
MTTSSSFGSEFSHILFIPSSQISALPLVLSFQNRTGGEQCTSRLSTST